jgi:hypothetical protein
MPPEGTVDIVSTNCQALGTIKIAVVALRNHRDKRGHTQALRFMLEEILERPMVDDPNSIGARQYNRECQPSPLINKSACCHFTKAIQWESRSIHKILQGIASMRPNGRDTCAPRYAINITFQCSMSYPHTCNIGNGIQRTRL